MIVSLWGNRIVVPAKVTEIVVRADETDLGTRFTSIKFKVGDRYLSDEETRGWSPPDGLLETS